MTEEWRPVEGFEEYYEVSNFGRVRSLDRMVIRPPQTPYWRKGIVLTPGAHPSSGNRPHVNMSGGGKKKTAQVSVLVAEAFIGPRPDGMECCHYDDDPLNNHVDNLRWDTSSANSYDAVRNGKNVYASKTHCKHGHEFNDENTINREYRGRRFRVCRQCGRNRVAVWYRNRKLARAEVAS